MVAVLVDPVDVLVAVGPYGLVGHADEPGHGVLGPVLDEEGLAPRGPPSGEEREQRAALDLRARLAARELDERRRDVLADHQLAEAGPRLDPPWIAHEEGRADALLVGETALGPEPVLTEEVPVVAEEDDDRVVERAGSLQRIEERADALVHRRHHARPEPDLLLRPRPD